jgi:hypothetical protein
MTWVPPCESESAKQVARGSARNSDGHDELRAIGWRLGALLGAGVVVDGGAVDD